MKKLFFLFAGFFFVQQIGLACICPDYHFEDRFVQDRCVFVGKLTEIFSQKVVGSINGDWFKRVLKFKVLKKSVRGKQFRDDWIYVLGGDQGCGSFCDRAVIGDTILAFAGVMPGPRNFWWGPQFIMGDGCDPYKILNADTTGRTNIRRDHFELDDQEKALLADSASWKTVQHAPDTFPKAEIPIEKPPFSWPKALFGASVFLNFLLLFFLMKRRKRREAAAN